MKEEEEEPDREEVVVLVKEEAVGQGSRTGVEEEVEMDLPEAQAGLVVMGHLDTQEEAEEGGGAHPHLHHMELSLPTGPGASNS